MWRVWYDYDDYDYYDHREPGHSYKSFEPLTISSSVDGIEKALENIQIEKPTVHQTIESPNTESRDYFCGEEQLNSSDVSVVVAGVGKLFFPLDEETVTKIIQISEKAKFGSLTESLFDLDVRDTQVVPASELKISINEQALEEMLRRMCASLNIGDDCKLVPHIYNLLVYGPGQFFKIHKDTEKINNMVATLVIVLPSLYEGGGLEIKHRFKKYEFLAFNDPKFVTCVAFFSDCEHEVKIVTKGFRVSLTFNVELVSQTGAVPLNAIESVNENLYIAIADHFTQANQPKRLVVFIEHSYSEQNLKWHLLKGKDRTVAFALFAIAKKQNLVPFLALSDYQATFEESEIDHAYTNYSAELYYWINEHNEKFYMHQKLNLNDILKETCHTFSSAKYSFKEYKEKKIGWYGNGPAIKEYWYHKSCVVLLKKI